MPTAEQNLTIEHYLVKLRELGKEGIYSYDAVEYLSAATQLLVAPNINPVSYKETWETATEDQRKNLVHNLLTALNELILQSLK